MDASSQTSARDVVKFNEPVAGIDWVRTVRPVDRFTTVNVRPVTTTGVYCCSPVQVIVTVSANSSNTSRTGDGAVFDI